MSALDQNTGFPQRLKKLRLEKGFSQTDIAKTLGVHPNHISRYERGETTPGTKSLKAIADCLGVSVDYLYDGVEEDAAVADMKDKELLELFSKAEKLSEKDKETIKELLRAFLKNKEMEKLLAS